MKLGTIATVLVALIALLHLYIAWFEMFAWEARGPKVFSSFPPELFPQTTELAFNQGVYNLFLAIGLIVSRFITDRSWADRCAALFLIFVVVAGIAGAVTASPRIFLVQSAPALLALGVLWLKR